MEIILLVITIFSGESFSSIEIRNYSETMSHEGDCESYIGTTRFRNSLKLKGIAKPKVRVACLGASQLPALGEIIKQSAAWKEVRLQQKEDVVVLTGKIRYTPIENRRKSVESYLGRDLVLVTSDGEHALYPSETVKEKDLIKLDGKKVRLRAIFEDYTPAAGSQMQYPTDEKGRPLKRVGYRVIAIE